MTPEIAKKWLPILQGILNGKIIQHFMQDQKHQTGWVDYSTESIEFDWNPDFLRVKPEPREFWIVQRYGSPLFQTIPRIDPFANKPPIVSEGESIIHVREVIDE